MGPLVDPLVGLHTDMKKCLIDLTGGCFLPVLGGCYLQNLLLKGLTVLFYYGNHLVVYYCLI